MAARHNHKVCTKRETSHAPRPFGMGCTRCGDPRGPREMMRPVEGLGDYCGECQWEIDTKWEVAYDTREPVEMTAEAFDRLLVERGARLIGGSESEPSAAQVTPKKAKREVWQAVPAGRVWKVLAGRELLERTFWSRGAANAWIAENWEV